MEPVSLINSIMCRVGSAGKTGAPTPLAPKNIPRQLRKQRRFLLGEQIQRLDDHPLEGDDVSMRDGGFGEGDELVPPQQETVATGPETTQTRDCGLWLTIHLQEYSLSDMYTIARDPVKSIDKVRDNTDHG
ncbi:hypothetical protein IV203_037167 [Nitzschia inconspicua]|uniref:Uncharacterized protein n=1 Tax=Nitzschia inconspicua TaxID=303405 RepID=A0A9K3LK88_9STRA|nr:hypothetical protein IV203_037167 [Nitzschia inconspicua]